MMFIVAAAAAIAILYGAAVRAALPTADTSAAMTSRTNFCAAKAANVKGKSMSTSLQGQKVNVGVDTTLTTQPAMISFDPTSGAPTGGLVFIVMKALAATMGFTVNYVQLPPKTAGQTNSQYLIASAPYVDIAAPFMGVEDVTAALVGVLQSPPIVISPTVLVTTIRTPVQATLWNFFTPFEFPQWALMLGLYLFNGIVCWLCRDRPAANGTQPPPAGAEASPVVEGASKGDVSVYDENTLVSNIYYSINTMSGEKAKADRNHALQLITLGFNFLVFIIVSAYTANLAALLVAMAAPPTPLLDSISTANVKGAVVCVLQGSPNVRYLRLNFPRVRVLEAPFPTYLTNINDGKCDGALVYTADWMYYQGLNIINSAANLKSVGDPLMSANYVLPFFEDDDTRCTSFLLDAVSYGILTGLAGDTFGVAYNASVTATRQVTAQPSMPPSLSLTPLDMGGIFVVYAIFVGLSLVVLLVIVVVGGFKKSPPVPPLQPPVATLADEDPPSEWDDYVMQPSEMNRAPEEIKVTEAEPPAEAKGGFLGLEALPGVSTLASGANTIATGTSSLVGSVMGTSAAIGPGPGPGPVANPPTFVAPKPQEGDPMVGFMRPRGTYTPERINKDTAGNNIIKPADLSAF